MPSARVVEIQDDKTWLKGVSIPVIFRGKRYIVNCHASRCVIIDIDGETIHDAGELETNNIAKETRYLGHAYNPSSEVLKIKHVYARHGQLVVAIDKVDLSSRTATRSILKTISLGWLTEWGCIAHGTTIPPSLAMLVDWANHDVHYVNVETGSVVDIDLGEARYENEYRFSHKFFAREDDIVMLAGKHLAGSTHEMWKVYSKQRKDLGFSTGGGSPRPCIGGMAVFTDKLIVLASSGGVVDRDNDFAVLDHNFNRIATIDVSDIVGHRAGFPHGHIIAKRVGGGYYAIIGADNNAADWATRFTAYWVEFDESFNVVSKTKLISVSVDCETTSNLYPGYSDITSSPVLDMQRKMVYFYTREHKQNKGWLVKVDISDVWDKIEEFNQRLWIVGSGRIPTILTLAVAPG